MQIEIIKYKFEITENKKKKKKKNKLKLLKDWCKTQLRLFDPDFVN